ncbi:hypothetical protein OJ996_21190 [Luteolibacter sp. GHJ8]|uniref:DUF3352 domain-containing protein n=1 Tax=Luteolibacter rhizosphaerae TaxID=2989719 RepID=A0ABT3G8E3_9BACT|nr:hypothetical protein [Luteolibacter rhizosphaerae]MCW1916118.1 hypothetical protein [Luteolibacter rhizosphaerae]
MKSFRTWWSVLPASALVLSACGKKEKEESAPPAAGPVAEAVKAVVGNPAPEVKALSPGERAAMLGIVGRLSKDTESVLGIYDGKEIVKRLKSLKTWGFIREVAQAEGGTDPEAEITEGAVMAGKFVGQEIFMATGKGTAPQVKHLMDLSRRSNYFQMRVLTQAFAEGAKTGDFSGMDAATQSSMLELAKELGKEMPLIEGLAVPPVLMGIKAEDAETLGMAQQQLASGLEMAVGALGEAAAPIEFTKGGAAFKGVKIAGTFLATTLEQGRAEIDQMLAPADVDKLIEALKKKNIVIAYGSIAPENYLMLYLGDSEEALPLVDKVEDSLAANEGISYVDGYKDKKIVGFTYAEKGLTQSLVAGSLKDMALGVRDGLTGSEAFGDTRELASLLELVGEKEDALIAMAKADTSGGLIVLDEGVKFELFGGVDRGAFDHGAAHKLSKLGGGEGVLMFGNWVSSPEYNKRANEYGEAIIETGYAIAEKVAGLNLDDNADFAQFKQGFGIFNEKFRTDTIGIWDALQTAEAGLGTESALVVDLKGGVPTIPGLPQELIDGGKFVRASVISPVTDRAKLQESWTKVEGSLKNIFKTVSEISGNEIPMQKPTSSERNGHTAWSFPLPFTGDDLNPCVTVGDKWFVASTSKLQAFDLIAAADSAGEDKTGAWFEFDFDALRTFSSDWVSLLEKHGEAVMGPNYEQFKAEIPRIQKGLEAFAEFDGISLSERVEGGKLRTSFHIKVR